MRKAALAPRMIQGQWKILRCHPVLPPALPAGLSVRLIWQRLTACFRLMVGVHDYQRYLQYMHHHQPDKLPMTEREFYRRCVDARFPGKNSNPGRCPC